jgi:hypothetical protein
MNHQSVFKTAESRDKIRGAYNEILGRFPFGQSYVDTTYGKTFILAAGVDGNPPILLLHGSCSNSAFWFLELMALSQNHNVFAVDIIGEAGNSEDRSPELTSDDYAFWLGEVLDALCLRKAIRRPSARISLSSGPAWQENCCRNAQTSGYGLPLSATSLNIRVRASGISSMRATRAILSISRTILTAPLKCWCKIDKPAKCHVNGNILQAFLLLCRMICY